MLDSYRLQVRFSDCDMMQHVNNAVYLNYFEEARIHYFRQMLGMDWDWKKTGVILRKNELEYLKPVFLHEPVGRAQMDRIFDRADVLVLQHLHEDGPGYLGQWLDELKATLGIPASIREAAAIDCKSGTRRFWTVILPLLTPTAFFLLVINMTYSLFDTFGVIDVIVKDKAANNPITLVYKVYLDGFRGNDLGSSSAQSVILMVVVIALTVVQFRFIERRVHY